jgi:alkylation response protein AidB-like acyl-CoA dehydrogenase
MTRPQNELRRAAIVAPIRTAVGKFGGSLSSMTAGQLGATILKALMERTKIDPSCVDDVIFAQGYGNGEAPCISHWSWLLAGLPEEVPGYQLDRRCGSGLQAIVNAAMMVQTGVSDVVVAGGCESMSNVEHYTTDIRKGVRAGNLTLHDRLTRGRVMSQPIAEAGYLAALIPEEYGGAGLPLSAAAAILEEVQRAGCNGGACHAQMYIMGTMLRHGSEAQKQALPAEDRGGGTAPAGLRRDRADQRHRHDLDQDLRRREGDHYIVNGQKIWTSRAEHSDLMLLLARTTPKDQVAKKTDGLSVFIVDMREALGKGG